MAQPCRVTCSIPKIRLLKHDLLKAVVCSAPAPLSRIQHASRVAPRHRARIATRRRLLVQTMRCFVSLSHTPDIVHIGLGVASRSPAMPPSGRRPVTPVPRPPNGFLASLSEDDFELVRPHLKTVDLTPELVLVDVDEVLKRAYLPHRGVISLVVRLARGEHVHIAMVGRHSIFGSFSALGDPTALNGAIVLVPGVASTLEIERLRAAADQSATLRTELVRHALAVLPGSLHPAAGQLHSLQSGTHRDHQSRRPRQDLVRMLRAGQGAVRAADPASRLGLTADVGDRP
jgi:hypothetical protein